MDLLRRVTLAQVAHHTATTLSCDFWFIYSFVLCTYRFEMCLTTVGYSKYIMVGFQCISLKFPIEYLFWSISKPFPFKYDCELPLKYQKWRTAPILRSICVDDVTYNAHSDGEAPFSFVSFFCPHHYIGADLRVVHYGLNHEMCL